MAICRNPLECLACRTRVITRTAIGHTSPQEHEFPCPTCGVIIQFSIDIDLSEPNISFRDPQNARWIRLEDTQEEDKVLSFDPERPFSYEFDMENEFSPFLSEFGKFSSRAIEAYSIEEGMRMQWRDSQWTWMNRLIVHFNRRNKSLFDEEGKLPIDSFDERTWMERLSLLYTVMEGAFNYFTISKQAEKKRVEQRISLAKAIPGGLFNQIVDEYTVTNRLANLWLEICELRSGFLENYFAIRPLLRMKYWDKHPDDISSLQLSVKRFPQLRTLYINCFETFCRLMVLAVSIESIIHFGSLEISDKKKSLTIWQFEELPNGKKPEILLNFPIHDLFVPLMDNNLRNGLGHNSASYSHVTDEVSYRKSRGGKVLESRLSYTEFCHKLLYLFSGVELASIYFKHIHLSSVFKE